MGILLIILAKRQLCESTKWSILNNNDKCNPTQTPNPFLTRKAKQQLQYTPENVCCEICDWPKNKHKGVSTPQMQSHLKSEQHEEKRLKYQDPLLAVHKSYYLPIREDGTSTIIDKIENINILIDMNDKYSAMTPKLIILSKYISKFVNYEAKQNLYQTQIIISRLLEKNRFNEIANWFETMILHIDNNLFQISNQQLTKIQKQRKKTQNEQLKYNKIERYNKLCVLEFITHLFLIILNYSILSIASLDKLQIMIQKCIDACKKQMATSLLGNPNPNPKRSAMISRLRMLQAQCDIRSMKCNDFINDIKGIKSFQEKMDKKFCKYYDTVISELFTQHLYQDLRYISLLGWKQHKFNKNFKRYFEMPKEWRNEDINNSISDTMNTSQSWKQRFYFFYQNRSMYGKEFQEFVKLCRKDDTYKVCNINYNHTKKRGVNVVNDKQFVKLLHNLGMYSIQDVNNYNNKQKRKNKLNKMKGKYYHLIYNICTFRQCHCCGNRRIQLFKCQKDCNKVKKFYFCNQTCHRQSLPKLKK